MKISELKEYQTINRPTKNKLGNRIYEQIEFEKAFDPTIKSFNVRLFSKGIDLALIIILQNLFSLNQVIPLYGMLMITPIVLLLANALMESIIGSSTGKLIFQIAVVDDHCKYFSFKKSLHRNLYPVLILPFLTFSHIGGNFVDTYLKWLQKKRYYVIRNSEKKSILKKLNG